MKSSRALGALLALTLVFSFCVYSQAVTGSVPGTVTGSIRAVAANAKVTLTESKQPFLASPQTNNSVAIPVRKGEVL